jgi:16S rRNA (adenine1518-N6/adenine1519-N6)-dimethyltransferase
VLEVGAGPGVLTRELAQRARRVVAVELDRAVLPVLRETTAGLDNVEIIPRNLLEVQPEEVFGDEPYKLVANLPYYITSLILRYLLESANPPRVLVVMVQREVAERLVAGPGEMSLLALSVQFYGVPRIVSYVPATAFYPPPRVDSAVVRVDLHTAPPLDAAASEMFFALIHAGFAEKRKQLHNTLARHLSAPRETIRRWLAVAEIDPMRRAQTLSLDEWLRLTHIAIAEPPEPPEASETPA